jgi:hypothetical protein
MPYNPSVGSGTAYYANTSTPYQQSYKRVAMPIGSGVYRYPISPPVVDASEEKKDDNAGISGCSLIREHLN